VACSQRLELEGSRYQRVPFSLALPDADVISSQIHPLYREKTLPTQPVVATPCNAAVPSRTWGVHASWCCVTRFPFENQRLRMQGGRKCQPRMGLRLMARCCIDPLRSPSSWNTGISEFGVSEDQIHPLDPGTRKTNCTRWWQEPHSRSFPAAGDSDRSEVGSLDANRKISVVCSYGARA